MSSHNTENETSNHIAPSIYCLLLFRSPQNLKFPDLLPRRIVTFRVSPNPNLDTIYVVTWYGRARGAGVAQPWHT